MISAASPTCSWCGKDLPPAHRGRPRKYCSRSCRQRAYEQRHNIQGTPIPQNAVILTPEKADRLRDSLFQLRCAAEDIRTAVDEEHSETELITMCDELVDLARSIERLRY